MNTGMTGLFRGLWSASPVAAPHGGADRGKAVAPIVRPGPAGALALAVVGAPWAKAV